MKPYLHIPTLIAFFILLSGCGAIEDVTVEPETDAIVGAYVPDAPNMKKRLKPSYTMDDVMTFRADLDADGSVYLRLPHLWRDQASTEVSENEIDAGNGSWKMETVEGKVVLICTVPANAAHEGKGKEGFTITFALKNHKDSLILAMPVTGDITGSSDPMFWRKDNPALQKLYKKFQTESEKKAEQEAKKDAESKAETQE